MRMIRRLSLRGQQIDAREFVEAFNTLCDAVEALHGLHASPPLELSWAAGSPLLRVIDNPPFPARITGRETDRYSWVEVAETDGGWADLTGGRHGEVDPTPSNDLNPAREDSGSVSVPADAIVTMREAYPSLDVAQRYTFAYHDLRIGYSNHTVTGDLTDWELPGRGQVFDLTIVTQDTSGTPRDWRLKSISTGQDTPLTDPRFIWIRINHASTHGLTLVHDYPLAGNHHWKLDLRRTLQHYFDADASADLYFRNLRPGEMVCLVNDGAFDPAGDGSTLRRWRYANEGDAAYLDGAYGPGTYEAWPGIVSVYDQVLGFGEKTAQKLVVNGLVGAEETERNALMHGITRHVYGGPTDAGTPEPFASTSAVHHIDIDPFLGLVGFAPQGSPPGVDAPSDSPDRLGYVASVVYGVAWGGGGIKLVLLDGLDDDDAPVYQKLELSGGHVLAYSNDNEMLYSVWRNPGGGAYYNGCDHDDGMAPPSPDLHGWQVEGGLVISFGELGLMVSGSPSEGDIIVYTGGDPTWSPPPPPPPPPPPYITAVADTATVDLTVTTGTLTADVLYQMSITSDSGGLKLVNDAATPGDSYYYGTDGGGVKGWFPLAGDDAAPGSDTQVLFNDASAEAGADNMTWDKTTKTLHVTGDNTEGHWTVVVTDAVDGTAYTVQIGGNVGLHAESDAGASVDLAAGAYPVRINAGVLLWAGSTSGTVGLKAPAIGDGTNYTLPADAPTASGQLLASTTGGVTSWVDAAVVPSGSEGNVLYLASGLLADDNNFNWTASGRTLLIDDGGKLLLGHGGVLELDGASSGSVGFQAPATGGGTLYTLPGSDGSAGAALTTNGSQVLSWVVPFALPADPGYNAIFGWDDTDNAAQWWVIGSGLGYDHATHTLSASGGSGSPGGSDTYVQYNDGGIFGGDAHFVWIKGDQSLDVTGDGTHATGYFHNGVSGVYLATASNSIYAFGLPVELNGVNLVLDGGANLSSPYANGAMIGTGAGQKLGFWGASPVIQQAANQALTDSTGGSASTTMAAVSGTGDDTHINNALASLAARLTEIRALLLATGLGG